MSDFVFLVKFKNSYVIFCKGLLEMLHVKLFERKNLFLSFVLSFAFLFLVNKGNALVVDDFNDVDESGNPLEVQQSVDTTNTTSWNNSKLANVVGGCRKVVMEQNGKGEFLQGEYSHSQENGQKARSTITWGECKNGTTMDEVDLTIDGSEYFTINIPDYSEPKGVISLKLWDGDGNDESVKCQQQSDTEYRCMYSGFDIVDLQKIIKIQLIIDGTKDQATGLDFGVNEIGTGNSQNTVCGVVPTASNNYGAKDECGLCPNESGYGEGKDECGFCPNDTLPENYNYGDGKVCEGSCDVNGNCGWCPTVSNPVKDGGYTCTQCDDGMNNDGKNDGIDCEDPQCQKGVNGICDPSYDSEAPQCSNKKDDDKDGKVDKNDPACLDENGNYDPNLDDESDDPACSDKQDNDGDGFVDDKDPGCYAKNPNTGKYEYKPSKKSEDGPNTECSDAKDNDNDGYIDSKDPDCWYTDSVKLGGTKDYSNDSPFFDWNPWDPSESGARKYQCSDGVDNDKDGLIDEKDPGCLDDSGNWNPKKDSEINSDNGKPECSDGIDNDKDGYIDYPDDPGCTSKNDDSEDDNATKTECSDGLDNDKDGAIDEKDSACWVYDSTGTPIKYDPTLNDESGCTSSSNISNLDIDNERLATIGLNAALYLKKFHTNSSNEFKRTTLSAQRAGKAITKEINKVATDLKSYSVSCSSSTGTSCRNNNNSELNTFSKQVSKLNKLVRRAQRRGLFFKKNFEKKAISAAKQKKADYKNPRTTMLNNRKAGTRIKVYNNINSKVSSIKSLAIC